MVLLYVILLAITSINVIFTLPSLRDSFWPADLSSPFNYPTPSPINIDSSEVKLINVSTPLKFYVNQNFPYTIRNTGYSVQAINSNPKLAVAFVSGSIFGTNKYCWERIEYYFSGSRERDASAKIDGVGSPLNVRTIWRNSKYNNKTAILHRDGYVAIHFNVNVEGNAPNILFEPFSKVLKCVTNPGTSVHQTFTPELYLWFDQFYATSRFYSYPGSIGNYDCATIIQATKSLASYISIPQFKAFQNVKNSYGRPLTRVDSSYPSYDRPVVEVCGVKQIHPII